MTNVLANKSFLTYPSSACLINHSQFAQILWDLFLVCFRHRLHILQVGISGVTPGGYEEARYQFCKKRMPNIFMKIYSSCVSLRTQ